PPSTPSTSWSRRARCWPTSTVGTRRRGWRRSRAGARTDLPRPLVPLSSVTDGDLAADRFLRACRREPVDHTPVWFMRQAGRYLPNYRELRRGRGVLEMCRSPETAAEVTLLPFEHLPLDAAILFSDIMVPAAEMGATVRIEPG